MENKKIVLNDPEALFNDFTREDPWRIFRIMAEFVESFETCLLYTSDAADE